MSDPNSDSDSDSDLDSIQELTAELLDLTINEDNFLCQLFASHLGPGTPDGTWFLTGPITTWSSSNMQEHWLERQRLWMSSILRQEWYSLFHCHRSTTRTRTPSSMTRTTTRLWSYLVPRARTFHPITKSQTKTASKARTASQARTTSHRHSSR